MARRKSLFQDEDAQGRMGGARHVDDVELDITPMIDVTFLLLIFFIVTSTMQTQVDLDVPAAKHGVGVPSRQATIVTIRAGESSGDPPVIILGDGRGEEGTLDKLRRYVEADMKEHQTEEVIIKADRDVLHGFVQRVLKVIAEVARDRKGLKYSIGIRDEKS